MCSTPSPGYPALAAPMVQLDGRDASTPILTSTTSIRRVINRNKRLKRLLDLGRARDHRHNEKRIAADGGRLAVSTTSVADVPETGPGKPARLKLRCPDNAKGNARGRFRITCRPVALNTSVGAR